MRFRRFITLAFVLGLLLSMPLATEARSRSRASELDVAVTDVTASDQAGVGHPVDVEATITGSGGRAVSVTVELSVSPGGETQTQDIVISSGETETVSFSWTPANTDTYTSTVSAIAPEDPNPSNNSGSAETVVVGANEIIVSGFEASVDGTSEISGQAEIGVPTTGRYRRRGGTATVRYTGLAGQTGTTTVDIVGSGIEFDFTASGQGGVPVCYTVEIVDVEMSGYVFDSANVPAAKVCPEPTSILNAPLPIFGGVLGASEADSELDALRFFTPDDSLAADRIREPAITRYDLEGDVLNTVPLGDNGFYSGLAATVGGRIFALDLGLISPGTPTVDVFDSDLNQIDSFPLPEGFFATDITIGGDGTLYISGVPELFASGVTLGDLQARQSGQEELPEGRILRYDQQGNPVEPAWPADAVTIPVSVEFGMDGSVYVSDINLDIEAEEVAGVVRKFNPDGTLVETYPLPDPESVALDLAIDGDGNLYATDPLNQQVLVIDADGNVSTIDAFSGDVPSDVLPLAVQIGGENQDIYVGLAVIADLAGIIVIDESGNLVDDGFPTLAPGRFIFGY